MALSLSPITKSLAKAPFDCGYEELNQYLRHYAFKNDQLSIGKTFIALNQNQEVTGYLTLSSAHILAEHLPDDRRSKLPRYPIPAFRIGKLAVDRRFQSSGVGRWLLTQAFLKAVVVSENVGVYAVLVDAIDDKAKSFYLKYGFIAFESHPLTLFLPLDTIKAAMV